MANRLIRTNEDPVCGMTVDVEGAREKGLAAEHDRREYVFCGKGCMLDFGDDPDRYLVADFEPTMWRATELRETTFRTSMRARAR